MRTLYAIYMNSRMRTLYLIHMNSRERTLYPTTVQYVQGSMNEDSLLSLSSLSNGHKLKIKHIISGHLFFVGLILQKMVILYTIFKGEAVGGREVTGW